MNQALRFSIGALLLLLMAAASAPASAQEPTPAPTMRLGQYALEAFTVDDGLPSNFVHEVAQTPDGYLWIATSNGLVRFDGFEFTVFNSTNMPGLTNDDVEVIAATPDGSVWMANSEGHLLRLHNGTTTTFDGDNGFPFGATSLLTRSDGTLWIGTDGGALLRFDGERMEPLQMPAWQGPRAINSIAEERDGTLWLGSRAEGVYRYDDGRWEVFSRDGTFGGIEILFVGADDHGGVWAGGVGALFRYVDGTFVDANLWQTSPGELAIYRSMIVGPDGLPWIGGPPGILRPGAEQVDILGVDGGLPNDRVMDLHIDRDGTVWAATYGGLVRLKKGRFITYLEEGGATGFGFALLQGRDGTIWAGGDNGVGRFNGTGFDALDVEPDISGRYVWSLAEDEEGRLWAATTTGLIRIDGDDARVYTTADGLLNDEVMIVYADPAGSLWVGFDAGLGRIVDDEFEIVEGIEHLAVRDMYRDRDGLLWISLRDSGLRLWDGERLTRLPTADASWDPLVPQFYEDDEGTMWFASAGRGLQRIEDGSFTEYSTADGLPTNSVLTVLEDDFGTFWLNSDLGIVSVTREDLDDFDAGRTDMLTSIAYGPSEGVRRVADSRGSPSALKTSDGRVWFAVYDNAVAAADPSAWTDPAPPPVHIEQLIVGTDLMMSSRVAPLDPAGAADSPASPAPLPELLRTTPGQTISVPLPLGEREIEIHYTAVSPASPEPVRFRYRLTGDQDWTLAASRRFAHYTRLGPGEYEFLVAATGGGEWNPDPTRVVFTVPAYFYETTWFRALALGALVALGLLGNRVATRAYKRRAEQLTELVTARDQSLGELQQSQKEIKQLKDRLEHENVYLREEISATKGFREIVGESEQVRLVLHQIDQVAGSEATVLIEGETGTGKELVARAIHDQSGRSAHPLVKVNCAALPDTLIESELFGHEKGAFTGAGERRTGRFELADGGTLFLDEIGDLDAGLQTNLLRVLQEGEFERVGGTKTIKVDVRIIAATNRDLQLAIDEGRFRSDLYYRLNVFPIEMPPLRERREDIPLLVWHFVEKLATRSGKSFDAIPRPLMDALSGYDWPGNVRELRNVIERAVVLSPGPVLQIDEAFGTGTLRMRSSSGATPDPAGTTLESAERAHILGVLEECGWKIRGDGGAAEALGLKESTLRYRMKKLGIKRPG